MIWNMPPTCSVPLWGLLGSLSPRGNTEQANSFSLSPSLTPHHLFCPHNPALENIWRPQKWEYPLMFILAGSFSFLLLLLLFFFNNQSSRKRGELTAWQQQRNSLEKLRWILLRFQVLRQESQRSNRLLVVFNHFFCGTFLVHETNLSVQHEGAWEQRLSEWRLWLVNYYSGINYFLLTSLWWNLSILERATDSAMSLYFISTVTY